MNAKEVEQLITNINISDEEVLSAILTYTEDRFDNKENLIPPTRDEQQTMQDLRKLIIQVRPHVMEALRMELIVRSFAHLSVPEHQP